MEDFATLQCSLGKWYKLHRETARCFELAINIKNKISYTTQDGLDDALGGPVASAACLNLRSQDEMVNSITAIESLQIEMQREIDIMTGILTSISNPSSASRSACPVDVSKLCIIIDEVRQQTALEISVFENFKLLDNSDRDLSITYIACFQHTPYLSTTDLESVIGFQKK